MKKKHERVWIIGSDTGNLENKLSELSQKDSEN